MLPLLSCEGVGERERNRGPREAPVRCLPSQDWGRVLSYCLFRACDISRCHLCTRRCLTLKVRELHRTDYAVSPNHGRCYCRGSRHLLPVVLHRNGVPEVVSWK